MIDLSALTGITFFYSMGSVYGVYAHNPTSFDAVAAYQRFPKKMRENLVWIYLPISQDDRMLALGLREFKKGGQCIMV